MGDWRSFLTVLAMPFFIASTVIGWRLLTASARTRGR